MTFSAMVGSCKSAPAMIIDVTGGLAPALADCSRAELSAPNAVQNTARLLVTGGMTAMAMVGSRPCVSMPVTAGCGLMPNLRGCARAKKTAAASW